MVRVRSVQRSGQVRTAAYVFACYLSELMATNKTLF